MKTRFLIFSLLTIPTWAVAEVPYPIKDNKDVQEDLEYLDQAVLNISKPVQGSGGTDLRWNGGPAALSPALGRNSLGLGGLATKDNVHLWDLTFLPALEPAVTTSTNSLASGISGLLISTGMLAGRINALATTYLALDGSNEMTGELTVRNKATIATSVDSAIFYGRKGVFSNDPAMPYANSAIPLWVATVSSDGPVALFVSTSPLVNAGYITITRSPSKYSQFGLDLGALSSPNVAFMSFDNDISSGAIVIAPGNYVGIYTQMPPIVPLDIGGSMRYADGSQGAGKLLVSDANGIASWQTPYSTANWDSAYTDTYNATNTPTPGAIVRRDILGNFSAGEVTVSTMVITGGAGTGKVLASDSYGNTTWHNLTFDIQIATGSIYNSDSHISEKSTIAVCMNGYVVTGGGVSGAIDSSYEQAFVHLNPVNKNAFECQINVPPYTTMICYAICAKIY